MRLDAVDADVHPEPPPSTDSTPSSCASRASEAVPSSDAAPPRARSGAGSAPLDEPERPAGDSDSASSHGPSRAAQARPPMKVVSIASPRSTTAATSATPGSLDVSSSVASS